MQLIDLVIQSNRMGTGRNKNIQADDNDADFVRIRDIINYHRRDLATDAETQWRQLFAEHELTGVTATAVYPLTEHLNISRDENDYVRVLYGTKESNFRIVKRTQRLGKLPRTPYTDANNISVKGYCGFYGGMLIFKEPFTATSDELGADSKILIPHFPVPDDLSRGIDQHIFPSNPNYLIVTSAWQISIDDKVTPDRIDSLEALSQSARQALLADNSGPGESVDRQELQEFYIDY